MLDRINTTMVALYARLQSDEGQTMAEYALILALLAVVAAAAFTTLSGGITSKLTSVCTSVKGSAC